MTYDYDSLGLVISRLRSRRAAARQARLPGDATAGQARSQSGYGFDDIGNRKSAKEGGNENCTPTANGVGLSHLL